MKFLTLSAFFVSFASIAACPNLAGTYATCGSSTGEVSEGSSITQTISNGVTTYTITSKDEETQTEIAEKIVADGTTRTVSQTDEQTGMVFTIVSKASCSETSLIYNVKASLAGETFANLNMKISKVGNTLNTLTTGTANGEAVNETVICQ